MVWFRWFLSGALAVPLFHQVALLLMNYAGLVDRYPYSMVPTQPFGIPQVISLTFWGGVWGLLLGLLISERTVTSNYWAIALVFGAVAPTLVAMFVVPPLKGQEAGSWDVLRFAIGAVLNGAWGIGTGILFLVSKGMFSRRMS